MLKHLNDICGFVLLFIQKFMNGCFGIGDWPEKFYALDIFIFCGIDECL